MSMYGSQHGLNMSRRANSKGDLTNSGGYHYARSDVGQGSGNGYEPHMDGQMDSHRVRRSYTVRTRGSTGVSSSGERPMGEMSASPLSQRALALQNQCHEYLLKAEAHIQSGNSPREADFCMVKAREAIDKLRNCAMEMTQMGLNNEGVVRSVDMFRNHLMGLQMALTSSVPRRRSLRGSSGSRGEDALRSVEDARAWIAQQKRLIVTSPFGEDTSAIDRQLIAQQAFHSSIQTSPEVQRAREELIKRGEKAQANALDQEWESLKKMSSVRMEQLRDLHQILDEIMNELLWVNEKEEYELIFDWGDKNIAHYIPKKQEAYSVSEPAEIPRLQQKSTFSLVFLRSTISPMNILGGGGPALVFRGP